MNFLVSEGEMRRTRRSEKTRTLLRDLLFVMLPSIFFSSSCSRKVEAAAFLVSSTRGIQRRKGWGRHHLKSISLAATKEPNSGSKESRGLVLPSHPDLQIRSVMAPMVAASDFPFRYFLHKHCGVDLTYTQMLHSQNFVQDPKFRKSHLDLWEAGVSYPELLPTQIDCLGGLPQPDGSIETSNPVMVQIAGNDVDVVVKSATMILEHTEGRVAGIDLNCGCPQAIARKGNYGAFLMEQDFDRVCEILTALRHNLPETTAVSAKIRLPAQDETLKQRIPRLLDTGINFLTIHGRTLKENKTKVGACHFDRIRLAVDTAHKIDSGFPIVANGGMENYESIPEILESTGAVAAMSSEALLETPNLFQQSSKNLSPRELLKQQLSFCRDYLDVCAELAPPVPGISGMKKGGSFSVIRGHLFKFIHRYLTEQEDLRDRLAVQPKGTISEAREILEELEGRYAKMSDVELAACRSSSSEASWYRRHRKPDRRVHQKEIRVSASLSTMVNDAQTVEERKQQIQERIKLLKAEKKERQGRVRTFI